MSSAPTGEQYTITSGAYQAVVTEVGATLRRLTRDGRDLVHGFAAEERVSGGRGQNLLPWPNRIRDGRYTFQGVDQQLPLSEPARHNASHGLVRYLPWTLVDRSADQVVNQVRIFPQPGWAGTLQARVTHRVSDVGLTVTMDATNIGDTPVPFGYAAHPYLTVGEDSVDEVSVAVPAGRRVEVDERLLPTRLSPVDGTEADLRDGPVLGERNLDVALTDLSPDDDGRWRVTLSRAERQTELWADASMGWVQIFTGGPYRNWGVAVEPMTCASDAFNPGPTASGALRLDPGQTVRCQWGICEPS